MEKNNTICTCYELLQKILLEAFGVNVLYFTPPYGNLSQIDKGIRSLMWPDFLDERTSPSSAGMSPERRILVAKSNLGFYNIIVYMTVTQKPDFFSIGPFRSDEFTSDYFPQLVKKLQLPDSASTALKYFYEGLPFIQLSSIVNVTKHVISTFFPEFEQIIPAHIEFSEDAHEVHMNKEILQEYSAEFAENYKQRLFHFLAALKKGETDSAREKLTLFLQETRLASSPNIAEAKKELQLLNEYCQTAMLDTAVPPKYVLKLYITLQMKINSISAHDALVGIPDEMCRKYCLLIKNYAYSEYSKTVRAVIHYIQQHLDEELSLSVLAKYFHKNASTLSSSFGREIGISITNYIHQARIDQAILYLNTTDMTVSEVALAVGIQDFAYFSRLFRKQVGCSPREYSKNITD